MSKVQARSDSTKGVNGGLSCRESIGRSRLRPDGVRAKQRTLQVRRCLPGFVYSLDRDTAIASGHWQERSENVQRVSSLSMATPDYFLTDNEKVVNNKDLGRILEVYGVTRVTTPPYHPPANPVDAVIKRSRP